MLKQRIITAILLVIVLAAAVLLLPTDYFALVFALVSMIGAWEWSRLSGITTGWKHVVYALSVFVSLVVIYDIGFEKYVPTRALLEYALFGATLFWAGAALAIVAYPRGTAIWSHRPLMLAAGFFVLIPFWVASSWLHHKSLAYGLWIFAAVALTAAADAGAYLAGKTLGKHKLARHVSPGKTVEGFVGGVLLSIIVAMAYVHFVGFQEVTLVEAAWVGFGMAIMSVIGDLSVSLLKRESGVKDSSSLLPGHGGLMDRLDSLSASLPAFALATVLLGS